MTLEALMKSLTTEGEEVAARRNLKQASRLVRVAVSELENRPESTTKLMTSASSFEKRGAVPTLVRARLSNGPTWIEDGLTDQSWLTKFGTHNGAWEFTNTGAKPTSLDYDRMWPPLFSPIHRLDVLDPEDITDLVALEDSGQPADNDWELVRKLCGSFGTDVVRYFRNRLYAGAPVRSKPRRTYDPAPDTLDPEGKSVPMLLANLYYRREKKWAKMKDSLESFGKAAGLYDEISIKPLGKRDSEPFQMRVRKFGDRAKGPWRNLIDVGYGVSQVLPVVTDLLRDPATPMFLLQQPEVHLHPSAQAALGSLFCGIASARRKLIIETHSDHLLDRVRMDIRDGASKLKPKDVSILFFERGALEVKIHSLKIDGEGNILNAPDNYRKFFMEETTRSLGL